MIYLYIITSGLVVGYIADAFADWILSLTGSSFLRELSLGVLVLGFGLCMALLYKSLCPD